MTSSCVELGCSCSSRAKKTTATQLGATGMALLQQLQQQAVGGNSTAAHLGGMQLTTHSSSSSGVELLLMECFAQAG